MPSRPTSLPAGFRFSQASLQDFVDCPRRFQLRHILQLAWPAHEAEPMAQVWARLDQGKAFHRLVQQHLLGLPVERLDAVAAEGDRQMGAGGRLAAWWRNYLASAPADLAGTRYPEVTLSAPVGAHRLVATFDLLAVVPREHAVIADWKTSETRPARAWLAARMQTRVYRFLLVAAGAYLNEGQRIAPVQTEMLYWFAAHPQEVECFEYDDAQFAADGAYLGNLVSEIAAMPADGFLMTSETTRCLYCPYRSLCQRGACAGVIGAAETATALAAAEAMIDEGWEDAFAFDRIDEVSY